jgi:hypothetical protein
MQDKNNTPKIAESKPSVKSGSATYEANSLLGALGMLLNELHRAGLEATATNDDTAGALTITIKGAQAKLDGVKIKFTARAKAPAPQPTTAPTL